MKVPKKHPKPIVCGWVQQKQKMTRKPPRLKRVRRRQQ